MDEVFKHHCQSIGQTGIPSLSCQTNALAVSDSIAMNFPNINPHSESSGLTKPFFQTLRLQTGEQVLPIAERAFPHHRSFTFGQTGPKLDKFLDADHYSDNLIQQCETLKSTNPAAVRNLVNKIGM